MSKSELRSRAGERMRMTAPSVPKVKSMPTVGTQMGGSGKKYGRLTDAR
jgi:hypothetical protein